MEKFLQLVGWLGVGAVTLILLVTMLNAGRGANAVLAFAASMTWALPSIVGFVVLAAFGSMLAQLKAIRSASEKQVELFHAILRRRSAEAE